MKRFVLHTLAAACLAAAVGPALADASSSATFGNLVITLTDLDPNDGITPSLAFTYNGLSFVDTRTEGWGDLYESNQYQHYGSQQQGSLTGEMHTAWSAATASVTTANNVGGFSALSAQGVAHSGLDGYGTYSSFATGATPVNEFVLSANTQVSFSVQTDLHAATSMGYNLDADMGEYALARVLLNVGGTVGGNGVFDAQEKLVDAAFDVLDDNTTTGVSNSWSGLLSVSFANTGSSDASGWLQTFVTTQGNSALWDGVTPVPEPSTYMMMVGGLALLGWVGRRRRR